MIAVYSILIVTGRELLAEGLRSAADASRRLRLVGVAANLAATERLTALAPPDLVLIDGGGRIWSAVEGIRKLQRRWPSARILVLVTDYSETVQAALLRAGLPAWAPDHVPVTQLTEKLMRLASRSSYSAEADGGDELPLLAGRHWRQLASLTVREQDVLSMLAQGRSNKEIAGDLGMSELTVKSHLKVIYSKLTVQNRVEATLIWRESCQGVSGRREAASL